MPPNAEVKNLRSRSIPTKKSSSSSSTANDDPATQSTSPVNRTLKSLNGNEIAIDGVIYDIDGFVHPGGEVISFFGGNDVRVLFVHSIWGVSIDTSPQCCHDLLVLCAGDCTVQNDSSVSY